MRRTITIFAFTILLGGAGGTPAGAQSSNSKTGAPLALTNEGQPIDGVAARIEDSILTESELRELAGFQKLVDGSSKSRDELIGELADQWIVRGEAAAANYPQPSKADVDRAYQALVAQFPSPEEFNKRRDAASINDAAVRRLLAEQLYVSRFLDYRFRPAAQVDANDIENYYESEFVPQLKARNEGVPPLENVQNAIREVLIQRAIDARAKQWLDDTRPQLKIDVMPQEGAP
jgi:hypothetical protein